MYGNGGELRLNMSEFVGRWETGYVRMYGHGGEVGDWICQNVWEWWETGYV